MTHYTFDVQLPSDVPADVVAEYIGAALQRYVKDRTSVTVRPTDVATPAPLATSRSRSFTEPVRQPRSHPFDGPEVFDDEVTPETFTTVPANLMTNPSSSIQGDYPHLSALLAARRAAGVQEGEGDWQLENGDQVGQD